MRNKSKQVVDTSGAASELGYIFTFLLGVLLLSVLVFGHGILKHLPERGGMNRQFR